MEYLEIEIKRGVRTVKRLFTVLPSSREEIIDLHTEVCREHPSCLVSFYWGQGYSYLKGDKKYQDL
jgi:hypothetical protein